jgi:histone chaperone ASF1
MAKVQVCNVVVLDNPSPFLNPFQFEVTVECIEELKEGMYMEHVLFSSSFSNTRDFLRLVVSFLIATFFLYAVNQKP